MLRIAVAVSGGVDSLYALASLKEAGHDVTALHGLFLPATLTSGKPDPLPTLRIACAQLGLPLHVVDLRAAFDSMVVAPFVAAYASGRTPNPCALCNAQIKFGLLMDAGLKLGAERLATGHYARIFEHPCYGTALGKALDQGKDQSYFLSLVPAARLFRALFPLEKSHKSEVMACVAERGLQPLPGESQDICFVTTDQYRPFVRAQATARNIALPGSGPMLLDNKVLGHHQGLWQYTEGQRKGLGIAHSEPLYVLGKDTARNALLLGEKKQAVMTRCRVEQVNILVAQQLWPKTLLGRVRYRQQAAPVTVHWHNEHSFDLLFSEAQSPTAPGQIAAVYDTDGTVLAGGIITHSA